MKLKNTKIYGIVRNIYYKYPSMRGLIFTIQNTFLFKPIFVGGLLKTECQNPWDNKIQNKIFNESIDEIKKKLQSNLDKNKVDSLSIDVAKWRYWIVSYAIQHSIEFSDTEEYNFVECGVAEGFSSSRSRHCLPFSKAITSWPRSSNKTLINPLISGLSSTVKINAINQLHSYDFKKEK